MNYPIQRCFLSTKHSICDQLVYGNKTKVNSQFETRFFFKGLIIPSMDLFYVEIEILV